MDRSELMLRMIKARGGWGERPQWDKVKSYAQKWLDQEPNDVYAIQSIGEALEKQGFVDEALQQYERALLADKEASREFGPGHTFFLDRLDILYHRAGRYEDCLRVCNYYTKQHANLWDAWNRLRRAAKKTGNIELSITAKEREILSNVVDRRLISGVFLNL